MNVKTLETLRKKESSSKSELQMLPSNFFEDCKQAMDHAFKSQDYRGFVDIQRLVKNINQMRQGKILKFAIYRSIGSGHLEKPENILPHEEKLLNKFMNNLLEHNDELDLMLDGYYFQEVK